MKPKEMKMNYPNEDGKDYDFRVESKSIVDFLLEAQIAENKIWNEYTDVLAIPYGEKLIKELQRIKRKWWYQFFTFIERVYENPSRSRRASLGA